MSTSYMVLTAVGPDRPGLVKEVSGLIHQAGCNLEDSRMAILAGEFALIVLFSGSSEAISRVNAEAGGFLERDLGFRVTMKPTQPSPQDHHQPRCRLSVTGADQPGIVHRISEVLASQAINVASLESRLTRAAFSGIPLFTLQAELQATDDVALQALRDQLEPVCDELHLHLELQRDIAPPGLST